MANRWAESHLPITAIDEANHVIRFGKKSVFLLEPGDRYWIENVKENLSEPGEFYVDPREQAVYLIPPVRRGSEHGAGRRAPPGAGPPACGQARRGPVRRASHVPGTGLRPRGVVLRSCGPGTRHHEARRGRLGPEGDPASSGFGQAAIGVPGAIGGRGVRSCTFEALRDRRTSAPTASSSARAARTTASAAASSPTWEREE